LLLKLEVLREVVKIVVVLVFFSRPLLRYASRYAIPFKEYFPIANFNRRFRVWEKHFKFVTKKTNEGASQKGTERPTSAP